MKRYRLVVVWTVLHEGTKTECQMIKKAICKMNPKAGLRIEEIK